MHSNDHIKENWATIEAPPYPSSGFNAYPPVCAFAFQVSTGTLIKSGEGEAYKGKALAREGTPSVGGKAGVTVVLFPLKDLKV